MSSNRRTRVLVMNEAEHVFHLSTNSTNKFPKQHCFQTPEKSEQKENVKTHVLQQVRVSTPEKISNLIAILHKNNSCPFFQKNYANHETKYNLLKTFF